MFFSKIRKYISILNFYYSNNVHIIRNKFELLPRNNLFRFLTRNKKYPNYPNYAIIDPINICNLKCSLCPTGNNKLEINNKELSLKDYIKIVNRLPFINIVGLYNWGEPLINRDILRIIKYSKMRGLFVETHSNLSFKKKNTFFKEIVNSNLDKLVVSLDGITQKSYSAYRVGGEYKLVFHNLNALVYYKKKMKKTIKIIWKFIINKFNEKDLPRAEEMAKKLGVPFLKAYLTLPDKYPDYNMNRTIQKLKDYWLPFQKIYISETYRHAKIQPYHRICSSLFSIIVIDPNGDLYPCYYITDSKNKFGNILKNSFSQIWYGDKYLYSRSLFLKKNKLSKKTICMTCNNFKKKIDINEK